MKPILVLPVLCAALVAAVRAAHADDRGVAKIVAIGGALEDDNQAVFRELLGRDGVKMVLVVPYSSADASEAARSTIERLRKAKPEAEFVVMADSSRGEEEKKKAAEEIGRADAVYFTGGDQSRLISRFYDGENPGAALVTLRAAMRDRAIIVGGTSAGCACLSDPMFTGGGSETALGEGTKGVQIGRGLGLVGGSVIMDSHTAQRGRVGRMVAALERSGKRFAIGVNENRAVSVQGDVFRGVGSGAALVVDGAEVKREGLSRRGARLSLLGDGDELNAGAATPAGGRYRLVGSAVERAGTASGKTADGPDAAWGKNAIVGMLRRLAADPSRAQHARSDGFEVTISADARTRFAVLGGDVAALSVAEATLDIVERPRKQAAFRVVAPAKLAPALAEYIEAKRAELPTELVTLEEALAKSPGSDDPEKLKRYLHKAWHEEGVRYVLLVGDADIMPVRYMVLDRATPEAFDYAFYPSDLYYADVAKADGSFDDWNGAKDGFHAGYFGEVRGEKNKHDPMNYDGISYVPELAVGRWPVDTEEEVRSIAAKSLAFQRAAAAEPARAAMLCVGGWVDARAQMDRMGAGLADAEWGVEKRYYTDGNAAWHTAPPSEAEVVSLLNSGVRLIVHGGHGADDQWAGSISVASLPKLHNREHPAIMLSAGCSTARFATLPPYEAYEDVTGAKHKGTTGGEVFTSPPPPPACYARGEYNKTGLGEQLLRAGPDGAAAYVGCNTGSQPCALTLLEGFEETLKSNETARLGDCWAGAIAYYYEHEHLATLKPTDDWYPASIYFQGMKFMLFGDPTLTMRHSDVARFNEPY